MKLARPDVFHPRIVLAGCPRHVGGDGDDAGLVAALRQRGLHARWLSWDDPEVAGADLVILRATRDYADRLDDFLAWTRRVANLLNPPAVVAWNTDRRYLTDLTDRGVPTVPGEVVAPGERARLPRRGDVFVGPAVGTGTRRFGDRSAARAYIEAYIAASQAERVRAARGSGRGDGPDLLGRQAITRVPARSRFRALGRRASRRWPPLPRIRARCCTRGRTSAVRGWWSCNWWSRRLAGDAWTPIPATSPSGTSRWPWNQLCERLGLGPLSHRRP